MPRAAAIIFAASSFALLFVYIMQYGFGLEPCILCLWQRVPFGIISIFSLLAFVWRPYGPHTHVLLGVNAALFLFSTGLALFHSGVELHWWLGTAGCAIQPLHGSSAADLRTELLHTVVARCDQITWTFLDLSMANWNIPFSFCLALFSGAASRQSAATNI